MLLPHLLRGRAILRPVPAFELASGAERGRIEPARRSAPADWPEARLRWAFGGPTGGSRYAACIAAATVLGFLLRLACIGGDLGLDEAWSLKLVAPLHAIGGVFWGLSHDNNHFLNSAWLYLMGQNRPAWLYRLPALVLGTLSVPAMARWLGRSGAPAGVAGALLAAVSLPLVDFGSEARGYAGLALASILALDEADRAVALSLAPQRDETRRAGAVWRLALAVGFGALCHLAMAMTVAVIGLSAVLRIASRTRQAKETIGIAARLFWPSALLLAPSLAAVAAGLVTTGRWTIGDVDPYSVAKLVDGLGGMLLMSSGLPDALTGAAGVAGTAVFVIAAARLRLLSPSRLPLAVATFIALPLGLAIARLPNVGYPRYFTVCCLVLLGLQAEALGTALTRGGVWRGRAVSVGMALVLCSLVLDGLDIWTGRGAFTTTLGIMTTEVAPTYTSDRAAMVELLLDQPSSLAGKHPVLVPDARFCADRPEWYIAVGLHDPRPDTAVTLGPPECSTTYRMRASFLASPLSGTQWTLFRRS